MTAFCIYVCGGEGPVSDPSWGCQPRYTRALWHLEQTSLLEEIVFRAVPSHRWQMGLKQPRKLCWVFTKWGAGI